MLEALRDTPERAQQELALQLALAAPLQAARGYAAPELGRVCARAQELCKQAGETPQLFPALWKLWSFNLTHAEHRTAHGLGEQILSLAQRVQDPLQMALAHWALGVSLAYLGEFTPALDHLKHMIAFYDPQQHHSLAFIYGQDPGVSCLSWVAWPLWFLGYPDQSLKRSEEALDVAEKTGERFYEAELHRIKGELLLMQDDETEAEASFHKAIEVARRQQAKSWELRAATSMARLWQKQGKRAEARELLEGMYNWFTEGFDTRDLKEAKALLEELS